MSLLERSSISFREAQSYYKTSTPWKGWSYGADQHAIARRVPVYVEKILKGATPAELPVEQPTQFELVLNLKTAKALGITMPPSLLLLADEVIQ